jgi:hypothetical protein
LTDATVPPMSDVAQPSSAEDGSMGKHIDHHRRATAEDREFLEVLVFLRGLYAERGPRDRAPVASIATIIAESEQRMRAYPFRASA